MNLIFNCFFKIWNVSWICVSSWAGSLANLLCIVSVLLYVLSNEHEYDLIQCFVDFGVGLLYVLNNSFCLLPKRILPFLLLLFVFYIHILRYYPALNHCPCTLSCILHYWISFFSLVTDFVAKGQESVFELWGSTVIKDAAEVTRMVNIVMRLIPGRILILLLG